MATNSRLKELKGALKDVLAKNDEIVNHVDANREEGGPEVQVEVKHVEAFRSGLAKAREIRAEIEALEGHEGCAHRAQQQHREGASSHS